MIVVGSCVFSLFAAVVAVRLMRHHHIILLFVVVVACLDDWRSVRAESDGPKNIQDNSFLIEEAYNQEPGVVQHIFNWFPTWDHTGGHRQDFTFQYVMELPLGSVRHQFSFNPLVFEQFSDQPDGESLTNEGGWGDVLLNYRYQLTMDEESSAMPAIAPRFSLILPTGDEDRGLGNGEVGYQFNLPISKELERFALHFNAGYTFSPNVNVPLANNFISPGRDLHGYNLGGSVIWLATYDVNYLLECLTLWDDEINDLGEVDRTTTVLLNPGVRAAVFTGEEVQWIVGAGIPVGLTEDSPNYGVFIYMSVEHMFRKTE